jgi:uncharacterized protein YybS (DUF2232 family)
VNNARKLTEGAIFLAAFAVFLLLTIYVPVVAIIINFVLPLPFIMFAAKNNGKYIGAFLVAAVFIAFIVGSFMGLSLVLVYGLTGTVIGYLLQRNMSRVAILISSSLTFLVGVVILYAVSVTFFKFDLIHELIAAFKQSASMSQDMLKTTGKEDQIKKLAEQYAYMIKMIETLAPSVLIMTSILSVYIIQLICFPIAKRFGLKVQQWGNFKDLSLPRSLLWYYLIATGANIFIHPQEGTYLSTALINLAYILEIFMVLQGISFLFYIFHQKSVPKGVRVIITIVVIVIPIFLYIVRILGIIDLGLDLRKRLEKKE